MSPDPGTVAGPLTGVKRVLGEIRGPRPGPTLICVGGLHGNEAAGVLALERVLDDLEGRRGKVSGELVALAGNRAALADGRRYLIRDLNRSWTSAGIRAAQEAGPGRHPEDAEQLELLAVIDKAIEEARGPVFLLDLHTTSGPGKPFSTSMDSLPSRRFALGIPVPLIVGLGEVVDGTLMGYLADRGIPGIVFEGGKHDRSDSVGASEAGIWQALASAGMIDESDFPEVSGGRERLRAGTKGLPRVLELRHRHPVAPEDRFQILPGLRSFQRVTEGEVLGQDRNGDVRSPEGGRLLMPLYQIQGEDGFFLIRELNPFWLTLFGALRRVRVDRILHWVPGIRRDPRGGRYLVVDRRFARWPTVQLLHLFGYRKEVEEGGQLLVLKQAE